MSYIFTKTNCNNRPWIGVIFGKSQNFVIETTIETDNIFEL